MNERGRWRKGFQAAALILAAAGEIATVGAEGDAPSRDLRLAIIAGACKRRRCVAKLHNVPDQLAQLIDWID